MGKTALTFISTLYRVLLTRKRVNCPLQLLLVLSPSPPPSSTRECSSDGLESPFSYIVLLVSPKHLPAIAISHICSNSESTQSAFTPSTQPQTTAIACLSFPRRGSIRCMYDPSLFNNQPHRPTSPIFIASISPFPSTVLSVGVQHYWKTGFDIDMTADRDQPTWTSNLMTLYLDTIDAFLQYDNVLGLAFQLPKIILVLRLKPSIQCWKRNRQRRPVYRCRSVHQGCRSRYQSLP